MHSDSKNFLTKKIFSAMAVMAVTLLTACNGNNGGAVSDNMPVVSDNAVSEDIVVINVSGNNCYYTASGNLAVVSANNISDNQADIDNASQESVSDPEAVSYNGIDMTRQYTEEEFAELDLSGLTAEEVVDVYACCDKDSLTFMNLSKHSVSDVSVLVHKIEQFPNLTQVDMCDCGISSEQMDSINDYFPNTKFVWMIRVGRWAFRTDVVAFSTYQPKVITCRLTNKDAQQFKYCTDLQALDIGHNSVSDYSFLRYLTELRILIVADNYDTVNGGYVKDLSYAKYCTKLQYFEFFISNVYDLSFLYDLPNLKDVNLCYTRIDDFDPLLSLPNLERLWINCCGVSYDEYQVLKEAYPEATIMYAYAGSTDQGWRNHSRYYAMRDSFANNYLNAAFADPVPEDEADASDEDDTTEAEEDDDDVAETDADSGDDVGDGAAETDDDNGNDDAAESDAGAEASAEGENASENDTAAADDTATED